MPERPPSASVPTAKSEGLWEQDETPDHALERVLSQVDPQLVAPTPIPSPTMDGLMAGWIDKWDGKSEVTLRLSRSGEPVQAELLRELDLCLVEDAIRDRQLVLIERQGEHLRVIGMIATRKPKKLRLDAETIELLATRSLLLRVGRAALELRHDGNIELVGSRISAASRGLFRLVGRMLRLN
jgi:hypothetical protein